MMLDFSNIEKVFSKMIVFPKRNDDFTTNYILIDKRMNK